MKVNNTVIRLSYLATINEYSTSSLWGGRSTSHLSPSTGAEGQHLTLLLRIPSASCINAELSSSRGITPSTTAPRTCTKKLFDQIFLFIYLLNGETKMHSLISYTYLYKNAFNFPSPKNESSFKSLHPTTYLLTNLCRDLEPVFVRHVF